MTGPTSARHNQHTASLDGSSAASTVDRGSPLPLHYQLRQILYRRIQEGHYSAEEPFPSENDLEKEFSLSRITVRRALADLVQEGLIRRHSGRGTFLLRSKLQPSSERLGGLLEELAARGYKVVSRILDYGRRPVARPIANKFQMNEGESALYLVRLVSADGEPISLSTSYFRVGAEVSFTRQELRSASIFPLLEKKYGIFLRRADKTIEATLPTEDEVGLLQVEPTTPLLFTELIAYDAQGCPAAYVKAVYRGDRYKYHTSVTR